MIKPQPLAAGAELTADASPAHSGVMISGSQIESPGETGDRG